MAPVPVRPLVRRVTIAMMDEPLREALRAARPARVGRLARTRDRCGARGRLLRFARPRRDAVPPRAVTYPDGHRLSDLGPLSMLDALNAPPTPTAEEHPMPERPSILEQEHEDFRATARTFFERSVVPFHAQWEADGIVSRDVWLEAGKAGLLCFDVEEEYGGAGIKDFRYNMVLAEEAARAGASGPGFAVHTDIIVPYISALGNAVAEGPLAAGAASPAS